MAVLDIELRQHGAPVGDLDDGRVGQVAAPPDIELSQLGALVGDLDDGRVGQVVAPRDIELIPQVLIM